MTPTEIKQHLATLGGGANKRLGQHFLVDRAVLDAIVESADIKRGDKVLEIGPGLGVLTNAMLEKGADVVAIEKDRRFAEYLTGGGFASPRPSPSKGEEVGRTGDLSVVQGDAATLHWHDLVGAGPWKFVANLPYSITSLALRRALWSPNPPSVVVALVQREVAERAIAKDGKMSLLALMVSLASSEARIVRRVSAGCFFPPPKVESAAIRIVPMSLSDRVKRWGVDPEKVMELAKRGFAHPRKKLSSNLGFDLRPFGLSENIRAEDVTVEQWAKLASGATVA